MFFFCLSHGSQHGKRQILPVQHSKYYTTLHLHVKYFRMPLIKYSYELGMRSCHCYIPVIFIRKNTAETPAPRLDFRVARTTSPSTRFDASRLVVYGRLFTFRRWNERTLVCCDGCTKIGNGGLPYRLSAHARLPLG